MMRRRSPARSGGRPAPRSGRAGASRGLRLPAAALLLLPVAGLPGCDRNVEPFDPTEEVAQPDLRHIFPPAAESSARPGGAPAAMPAAPAAGVRGGAGAPIRGRIELAPELRDAAPAGAVLFVIARREGGGPPLAVRRIDAPRLPLDFELTPADRMIQALPWGGPLRITARLDRDGNATSRQPGDLQGRAPEPVSPGAEGVRVVLDERIE